MSAIPLQVVIDSQANLGGFRQAMGALDGFVGRALGLNGFLEGLRGHLVGLLSVGALKGAYQAAVDSGKAYAQLAQSVASSGVASGDFTRVLAEQAAALQQLTGVEDEAVMQVQGLLLSYGGTADQVQRLTPLVLDLAARMGMDARTAARQLGQALDGQNISLGRLNITAGNFDDLIRQLTGRVQGQAAAMHAAEGPMGRMRVAMGEAAEAVGRVIEPTVNDGLKTLVVALEAVAKAGEGLKQVWGGITDTLKGAGLLVTGLATARLPALVAAVKSAVAAITAAVMANPLLAAQLLVGGAVAYRMGQGISAYSAIRARDQAAAQLDDQQARLKERFGVSTAAELRALREAGAFGAPAAKPVDPKLLEAQGKFLAAAREDLLQVVSAQERWNLLQEEMVGIERRLAAEQDPVKWFGLAQDRLKLLGRLRENMPTMGDFNAPEYRSEASRRGLFASAAEYRLWTSQINISREMRDELKVIRAALTGGLKWE